MRLQSFAIQRTGLSPAQLFGGPIPLVAIAVDAAGDQTLRSWAVPGVAAPTAADIAAALAAPEPPPLQAQLAAALVAAAEAACDAVYGQIAPDAKHATAYANAAAMVGPGAVVPGVEPVKTAFASMAATFGFGDNPQGFATLVAGVAAASMTLSAILGALEAAAAPPTSAHDLAAALTTFEIALGTLVGTLNKAGLTITVTAPPAIVIAGINA